MQYALCPSIHDPHAQQRRSDTFDYLKDTRPQVDKLAERFGGALARKDGRIVDPDGLIIENFNLPLNLMLGVSCEIVEGGLAEAVAELSLE